MSIGVIIIELTNSFNIYPPKKIAISFQKTVEWLGIQKKLILSYEENHWIALGFLG